MTGRDKAFLTVGEIARRLAIPQHRLKYALTRAGIEPAGRVGILRFWSEADLDQIRDAVAAVGRADGATR